MKKTIYIIALTLVALTTKAQVTLDHTYSYSGNFEGAFKLVNLSVSGYKYCLVDQTLRQVRLYNLNHSLWKTINLVAASPNWLQNIVVSEQLFNSDNLVEVLYSTNFGANHIYDSVFVINELGSMVFSAINGYNTNSPHIQNDGVNFKLFLTDTLGTQGYVYSLTGTLPCDLCGGVMGISEPNSNGNKEMISNPFPNPTNDKTTITYELPEGINQGKLVFYDVTGNVVKEFNVDRTFKDLQVSNSDLSAGTYYYELQTSKGTSGGKKLVVVK